MSDEIFDPEIHATDKNGDPSLNKDGSFRKKRKDAGGASTAGRSSTRTRTTKSSAGNPRDKYHKAVSEFLQVPVVGLGFADPVLGFAAAEVAPMWSNALADLAVDRPRLAAMLEKAGDVGAIGGVVGAAVVTFVQFGHLLGKVPANTAQSLGCRTRTEIETILEQRGAAMAQARQSPEHARAEGPAAEGPAGVRVMAHA